MALREVEIDPVPPRRLAPIIGPERAQALERLQEQAAEQFAGKSIWNVNSTATGGGVAELLQVLLAYARGAGIDTRWLVIDGNPSFFAATKRLHNRLHGVAGDRGSLGPNERRCYDQVMEANVPGLLERVRAGDVVLLHDPQTLGLAAPLREAGAVVVWRCHVGSDRTNRWTDEGWSFLEPYFDAPQAFVFSRKQYVPASLDGRRPVMIIPPSIDPFSPKNQDIDERAVAAILRRSGLVASGDRDDDGDAGAPYARRNGAEAQIEGRADVVEDAPPPPDAPLIVQVSRWDRLKDMQGVLEAFAEHVAPQSAGQDVHLTLAGPSVKGVADDPEGAEVLEECTEAWKHLPADVRRRVHLASLPMDDVQENAVMVNALQRHAAVVTQKSLVEGFGLTVAEAMWKARPVVASAIGGILDQVADGETGLVVHDPADGAEFGRAVVRILADLDEAHRMGEAGRRRVTDLFLGDRHLAQYAELLLPFIQ